MLWIMIQSISAHATIFFFFFLTILETDIKKKKKLAKMQNKYSEVSYLRGSQRQREKS